MDYAAAISGLSSQKTKWEKEHRYVFFCYGNIGEMALYVKVKLSTIYAVLCLWYWRECLLKMARVE